MNVCSKYFKTSDLLGFPHTAICKVLTGKHPVSDGGKNMLMVPDIRGELVKLLQAYRKLKVMQITTHRRASLIAQHEDHHGRMEWSLLITGQVVGGLMDIQQIKPPCHNIQIISDCVFLITEWVLLKCLPQQLWYKMLQN